MAFASGSGIRVGIVAEVTFGTTPATPTFATLRTTTGSLSSTKAVVTSDERQADENARDEVKVGVDAAGTYGFELTYGGVFDTLLEAAFRNAFSTNVLTNGITSKSFTVEETLTLGAGSSFSRFRGAMVNTLALDISSRAKVTGSIGMMALEETLGTAILTGATYTAPTTTAVSSASANVAALNVGNLSLTNQPKVRRISLEINNGLRTRPLVGSSFSEEFGRDRFNVTGTLEAYFENNELYAAMLAHDVHPSLTFTVGVLTTQKYTFSLPNVVLGSGTRAVGGTTDDVVLTLPFRAVYDSGIGGTMRITRAVA